MQRNKVMEMNYIALESLRMDSTNNTSIESSNFVPIGSTFRTIFMNANIALTLLCGLKYKRIVSLAYFFRAIIHCEEFI